MTRIVPRLKTVEDALEFSRLEKVKVNILHLDLDPQQHSAQIKEAKKFIRKIEIAESKLKKHHDTMWNKFVETDNIDDKDTDELKQLIKVLINIKHQKV